MGLDPKDDNLYLYFRPMYKFSWLYSCSQVKLGFVNFVTKIQFYIVDKLNRCLVT